MNAARRLNLAQICVSAFAIVACGNHSPSSADLSRTWSGPEATSVGDSRKTTSPREQVAQRLIETHGKHDILGQSTSAVRRLLGAPEQVREGGQVWRYVVRRRTPKGGPPGSCTRMLECGTTATGTSRRSG
jgi:hypothetical protein